MLMGFVFASVFVVAFNICFIKYHNAEICTNEQKHKYITRQIVLTPVTTTTPRKRIWLKSQLYSHFLYTSMPLQPKESVFLFATPQLILPVFNFI